MSTYMKRFVYMSLFYLGLAALFGILDATTDMGYAAGFAHQHFNLLGFMSMIVFGIGYFILPRFNGTELRWESWVPIHFWLANISLIGMVLFRGLQSYTGADLWDVLFIIMASLQVVSLFMFIINIWVTLTPRKKRDENVIPAKAVRRNPERFRHDDSPVTTPPTVTPDSRVADLIDQCPTVQTALVDCGLKMLAVPGHLDKVRKVGVTLDMAAANHGLDLDQIIAAVKIEMSSASNSGTSTGSTAAPVNFDPEMLIGAVLEQFPSTQTVFERYFGDGCLDCPGQNYESIDLACRMHGVDRDLFIQELTAAAKEPV